MKTNKLSIIGFILVMIATVTFLVYPDQDTLFYALVVITLFAICAVVLGFIAKKQIQTSNEKGKGFATTSRVLGIILLVLCFFAFIGNHTLNNDELRNKTLCPMTSSCVDNNDGTSTCKYVGTDIKCNNDVLTENNYR